MQLKDFIKGSLVEIAKGVMEANEELKGTAARVNPPNTTVFTNSTTKIYGAIKKDASTKIVELVEFDVAVHAAEGQENKGGFGIAVGAFALGSTDKQDTSSRSESRIKFKIPVYLPQSSRV